MLPLWEMDKTQYQGEPWDDRLVDLFNSGVEVSVVEYPIDDSKEAREVYQAGRHAEENNKFRFTAIHVTLNVGKRALEIGGGDMKKAETYLLDQYGKKDIRFDCEALDPRCEIDPRQDLRGFQKLADYQARIRLNK